MAVVQVSSGPNSPTVGADDASVGTLTWTNPGNITSSDNARATAVLNNTQSHYLKGTGFGFAIPTNATIDAIKVEVEKSQTAGVGVLADTSVRLVKRGVITGIDHVGQGLAWTGSDAYSTYGDATADLWGCVLSPDDVNSPDFGAVFSCQETLLASSATAGVDHIRITVTYTPGYDAAPQVQSTSEVSLYGHRYRLAPEPGPGNSTVSGKVHEALATQASPKIDTGGAYGRPTNQFIETYVVSDLRGGMGLRRYPVNQLSQYAKYTSAGERPGANRFWQSIGWDTFWPTPTLSSLPTSISQPAAVAGQPVVIAQFTNAAAATVVVVVYQADITYHDFTNWSAVISTLPAVPTDSVFFNARLFYALSTGYAYQTAADVAHTAVASSATSPAVQSWRVWDSKLWAIDTAGKIWRSSTGLAGAWQETGFPSATLPLQSLKNIELKVYRDPSGDPIIYALTTTGPWAYDAVNDKWFQSEFAFPPFARGDATSGTGFDATRGNGTVFRGKLVLKTGDRQIFSYDSRTGEVNNITPELPDGMPDVFHQGVINQFVPTADVLFCSMSRNTQAWCVLVYTELGWGVLHDGGETIAGYGIRQAMGLVQTVTRNRLYFSTPNAISGYDIKWIDLAGFRQNPLISTARTYVTGSSYLALPIFDAEAPDQVKSALQARIKLQGASATETVQLAYMVDGASSSTNLGSPVAANIKTTIPFGTGNVGLAFQEFQWVLYGVSAGSTAAPKLIYLALDFERIPEVKRAFTVNLWLKGDSPDHRSPQQQYDALYSALGSALGGTFSYRDDANNVRSFVVSVRQPKGDFETGTNFDGTMTLILVEKAAN